MDYLYGDSSPSPLQSDFLGFLGDMLDFSVLALLAGERMKRGRADIAERRNAAAAEMERLAALVATVKGAVDRAPKGEAASPTARCAATILTEVDRVLAADLERVRVALAKEVARIEAEERRERDSCGKILERLLLRHDPPEVTWSLRLGRAAGEDRYDARLSGATGIGLTWALELDIPGAHILGHIVRVDELVPRLEVHAPKAGGWLKKEVRIQPQRLERYALTELTIAPKEMMIKLRADADVAGEGFDVDIRAEAPHVRIARAGAQNDPPYALDQADAAKVHELHEKLLAAAEEIAFCRKRLVVATLDEAPFVDAEPKAAIERLIGAVTPVVLQIARHSLSPTELVLKRLVSETRREEVFVSKAALAAKLSPLPEPLRVLFAPLALGPPPSAAKPAPPTAGPVPPPLPPQAAGSAALPTQPGIAPATPPAAPPAPAAQASDKTIDKGLS
jgi:hypothetical protein